MREPSVSQVMTREVVTVRKTTPFKDVVELLDGGGFSAVPVVDERNRPIGVVSEADLLPKEKFLGGTAPSPALFANRARKERWRKAGGAVAGVVARRDLLRLFLRDDVLHQVFRRVLLADPDMFDVRVVDGVVSVDGKLERRSEAELAVRLIRAIPGVVDVASTLRHG